MNEHERAYTCMYVYVFLCVCVCVCVCVVCVCLELGKSKCLILYFNVAGEGRYIYINKGVNWGEPERAPHY